MNLNLSKFLGRLHTVTRVKILNIRGKKVSVGKKTIISRHADIVCGKHPLIIGSDTYISSHVILTTQNGRINVGSFNHIGPFCVLHGNCTIGDYVLIGSHVAIIPANHNFIKRDVLIRKQGVSSSGVKIANDVWIGAGTQVLDESNLGEGCVIGAGSVVKGTLQPYGVYVGSPVRKISERT